MGVTKIKEVLKPLVNHHMIGMASKLWEMYNSQKRRMSKNKGGSKTPLFTLNYGSIHMITSIFIQSMWSKKIFSFEKKKRRLKLNIEIAYWTNPYWLLK
jgi:hypothetical protein